VLLLDVDEDTLNARERAVLDPDAVAGFEVGPLLGRNARFHKPADRGYLVGIDGNRNVTHAYDLDDAGGGKDPSARTPGLKPAEEIPREKRQFDVRYPIGPNTPGAANGKKLFETFAS
jgi:hypothetical protein